jgi:hypothetical protein
MAPGAHQLVVGGDSCDTAEEGNQSVYDADIMILDGASGHPLATMASNSWESGSASQPLSRTNLVHAYLLRGEVALAGQAVLIVRDGVVQVAAGGGSAAASQLQLAVRPRISRCNAGLGRQPGSAVRWSQYPAASGSAVTATVQSLPAAATARAVPWPRARPAGR